MTIMDLLTVLTIILVVILACWACAASLWMFCLILNWCTPPGPRPSELERGSARTPKHPLLIGGSPRGAQRGEPITTPTEAREATHEAHLQERLAWLEQRMARYASPILGPHSTRTVTPVWHAPESSGRQQPLRTLFTAGEQVWQARQQAQRVQVEQQMTQTHRNGQSAPGAPH